MITKITYECTTAALQCLSSLSDPVVLLDSIPPDEDDLAASKKYIFKLKYSSKLGRELMSNLIKI